MKVGGRRELICHQWTATKTRHPCRDAKNDTLIFIIDLIKLSKMSDHIPRPPAFEREAPEVQRRTADDHRHVEELHRHHGTSKGTWKSSSTRSARRRPVTVLYLARWHYLHDGIVFHRVIPGFVTARR